MQVAHSLDAVRLQRPGVVTVGVFDGVHLGHQYLIQQLVNAAQAADSAAVVVSFYPHPDKVLRQIDDRYYLTTPQQKADLLAALGVDVLVLHPFHEGVRQMRAADFVDQLREHLNLIQFRATPDFAMGYRREGDIAFLQAQGQTKGFTVHTMELLGSDGERISSSYIRQLLQSGQVSDAARLLGRHYQVSGEVVHGEKRGRGIGFPTANIAVWEEQIIPAHGVYACRATLNDETLLAVTNIGSRPTFEGQGVTVEAHLLDFSGEIYGQTLTLEFVDHLRGEQRFNGIEALKTQIGRDRDQARALLTV